MLGGQLWSVTCEGPWWQINYYLAYVRTNAATKLIIISPTYVRGAPGKKIITTYERTNGLREIINSQVGSAGPVLLSAHAKSNDGLTLKKSRLYRLAQHDAILRCAQ